MKYKLITFITSLHIAIVIMTMAYAGSLPSDAANTVSGPLRPNPHNPRYFTDDSGKAIYLTGSHTWNNLKDKGTKDPPPAFDYTGYLNFLKQHTGRWINEEPPEREGKYKI